MRNVGNLPCLPNQHQRPAHSESDFSGSDRFRHYGHQWTDSGYDRRHQWSDRWTDQYPSLLHQQPKQQLAHTYYDSGWYSDQQWSGWRGGWSSNDGWQDNWWRSKDYTSASSWQDQNSSGSGRGKQVEALEKHAEQQQEDAGPTSRKSKGEQREKPENELERPKSSESTRAAAEMPSTLPKNPDCVVEELCR
jgi:hypothetical protein